MDPPLRFVFDGLTSGREGHRISKINNGTRRESKKRNKYTARACEECKKRKVKCSGEEVCNHCQGRGIPCFYARPAADAPPLAQPSAVSHIHGNSPEEARPSSLTRASTDPPAQVGPLSSALALSASDEPTVAGLSDRVRTLERMVAHLLESAKDGPRYSDRAGLSPSSGFRPQIQSTPADEDEEENMFAAREQGPDDLSLSSQVAAMGAFLSKPSSPKPVKGKRNREFQMLVELPDPPALQDLLDVYFYDMDCYFPFLDRLETQTRIYAAIRRLGYSSHNRILLVTSADLSLSLMALVCLMLALAECLDSAEGACDTDAKPGWGMYTQGCRAVQYIFHSRTADLDAVRAQCLISAYLMHAETLDAASQAVSVGFQMAATIKLNDQRTWSAQEPADIFARQRLWWTIYFLDRRIAQKSGTPYHIRNTEFHVEDFGGEITQTENIAPYLDAARCATNRYLQALISLARLWGHIWDTFFAVGATGKGDWLEAEIMDTQILNLRRQLPNELTWSSDKIMEYSRTGEAETQVRRRLQINTRLNLLRMIIRQNPVRQTAFNPEVAYFCARLSREVIHAHKICIARYPGARASGYFTTASIVECIYQLVPVLHYSKDHDEYTASMAALSQAHEIVIQLSTKLNSAKKALRALSGVTKRWGIVRTTDSTGGSSVDGSHSAMADIVDNPPTPHLDKMQFRTEPIDPDEWINMPIEALFGVDGFENGF